ncbi:hypothetical protein SAMN05660830_03097 [Halodesulfovibrio aestuarii]|uniref:Uncharacterized protein n=2 Tax=Halodesulfovibrio aestuarii TaxID=126333 RepID=A0A8G2FA77_9BACT|nr:hypothetical protein SAMN05660830_03097 [Halodesulfovibrio aestuarii]
MSLLSGAKSSFYNKTFSELENKKWTFIEFEHCLDALLNGKDYMVSCTSGDVVLRSLNCAGGGVNGRGCTG